MAKLTVSATKPLVWPEMDRSDDGVEGDLQRWWFGEVVAVDSGVASARGSACSMKWIAAELLDTTRGRTGGGERGYDAGTAAVVSAMAGAREGEELERRGGVWGVRGREGKRSTMSPGEWSGEAASRCVARAAVAVGHLPACRPASSSLERRWAGPAGGPGAGRQVSFFHFFLFSVFLILLQLC